MTQLASPGQGCSRDRQPPSLPTLPSPRRPSSDPECLGHPPPPRNIRTLPLYAHQGWAAGTSLPHGEIPAPTKFQIPWPYRAPFSLTFDGLPSVGGRTSPPSERQWGEAPLSHHPSPLGVSWPCTWNTQVVGTERKSSRDFGGRVDIGPDSDTWWSRGPVEPFQNGDATPK